MTEASEVIGRSQRAVIAAAGTGIDCVPALRFRQAGYRVHVCDISKDALEELRSIDSSIAASLTEVSDPAQGDELFTAAQQSIGGLDFLINNAGVVGSGPTWRFVSL